MPSIEGKKSMPVLCNLYWSISHWFLSLRSFCRYLISVEGKLSCCAWILNVLEGGRSVSKFATFIPISFEVHDQTVGKVLKKVREGGEGTTSKSEKGKYKSIIELLWAY